MNLTAAFSAGFAIKVFKTLADSSLYLLIGLAVSALLRATVAPARLRAWFGEGRWSGLVRAWAAAFALPVCSLGVLPVLHELKRSGVRRDALLTLALAAPIFNPLTLLYGFSYLGPELLVPIVLGSTAVAILAGAAVGRGAPDPPPVDEPMPAAGSRRLAAATVQALRAAGGSLGIDLAVGLVGAGLVAAAVQPSWLAEGLFAGDPRAVPRLAAVAPASYISPETGMTMLPEMLKFRQSAGAMFALMVLGVGMSLGHLSWIGRSFGVGVLVRWLVVVVALTGVAAVVVGRTHSPVGVVNPDNDHFEDLANPVASGHPEFISMACRSAWDATTGLHRTTLAAFVLMVGIGLALRSGRPVGVPAIEHLAETDPRGDAIPGASEASDRGILDRSVPGWVITATGLAAVGLAAFVAACAYYPSPEEVFRDMSVIKADFYGEISSPTREASLHHLELWERQTARLEMGAALRLRSPGPQGRETASALRRDLLRLREATVDQGPEAARRVFHEVQATYDLCRKAYGVH